MQKNSQKSEKSGALPLESFQIFCNIIILPWTDLSQLITKIKQSQ